MDPLILRKGMTLTDSIEDYPSGIIIPIDKPWRWTSADVIRKVKWAACRHFHNKKLKVGHAGTLDPLATGVLLVCIGKATKLADELQRHEKEYVAGVVFGATTPSFDREKEIDRRLPLDGVSEASLRAVLPSFIGEQEQVAPLFSAKSVDGVRAYEMARQAYKAAMHGDGDFDHSATGLLSRQRINISELELLSWDDSGSVGDDAVIAGSQVVIAGSDRQSAIEARVNPKINVIPLDALDLPCARLRVVCSKGTYIRALARDLGEALGSGAFLGSLRRTRSGGFHVSDALTLTEVLAALWIEIT